MKKNYMEDQLFRVFCAAIEKQLALALPGYAARIDADKEDGEIAVFADSLIRDPAGASGSIASDRRLYSVFHYLGKTDAEKSPSAAGQPEPAALCREWQRASRPLTDDPANGNAILNELEDRFGAVAAGENQGRRDISLYQQIRLTAAAACCVKAAVMGGVPFGEDALDRNYFLLLSLDFSGIQPFIYTVTTAAALKGVRARSFYLYMLMENIADDILDACSLSRANLIYAGGGRAQLLLPDTEETKRVIRETADRVNRFLLRHYGTRLYLSYGARELSGRELTSDHGRSDGLSRAFRETSRQLSQMKLKRYTYDQLLELNGRKTGFDGECCVCGAAEALTRVKDRVLCDTCARIERFSVLLAKSSSLLAVVPRADENALPLPGTEGDRYLLPAEKLPADAVRVYSVNGRSAAEKNAVRVYACSTGAYNAAGDPVTLEQLTEASHGIRRLGVLRCDVDNLGVLFSSGFVPRQEPPSGKYHTLARYASLSASLSEFFQHRLDGLLKETRSVFDGAVCDKVAVVYAGGDDVFLVGAWDQVLSAGIALRNRFREYTEGQVTLSAGFCISDQNRPFARLADESEELEALAKACPGKDAVSLFGRAYLERRRIEYTFSWDELTGSVLEKLGTLREHFEKEQDSGSSFLYKLLELFRDIGGDRAVIARLAYVLAKRCPQNNNDNREQYDRYQRFMRSTYQWALEPRDNLAFRTAVMLYVYYNRKKEGKEE